MILSLLIVSAILIICLNSKYLISHSNRLALLAEVLNMSDISSKFKIKYKFYPGDYPFAKSLWKESWSGNGDGYVRDYNESLYSWSHIENANMVNLNFIYEERQHASIEKNMIKSKYSNCGYQILADSKLNNLHFHFRRKMNFIRLGLDKGYGNLSKSCISSKDALFVDKKIDDAIPISGTFYADTGYENSNNSTNNKCVCKIDNHNYFYCNNGNINCIVQIKIP